MQQILNWTLDKAKEIIFQFPGRPMKTEFSTLFVSICYSTLLY